MERRKLSAGSAATYARAANHGWPMLSRGFGRSRCGSLRRGPTSLNRGNDDESEGAAAGAGRVKLKT